MWAQNAAFVWVPWIALASLAAWFGMNDIADARASFAAQAAIFRRKHNWIMCVLYLGTFGSFIGFSAGFPLLIKSQFPEVNPLAYAWLGPLVGALIRPVGGWLSDKLGGARVTLWNFVAMALAVLGVLAFLPKGTGGYALAFGPAQGSFAGFFAMFMVLFLTTGIGNGSTFRMIPVIFLNLRLAEVRTGGAGARAQATREGNTEGAAALGFAGALSAYGGFFIPKSYGSSIAATGGRNWRCGRSPRSTRSASASPGGTTRAAMQRCRVDDLPPVRLRRFPLLSRCAWRMGDHTSGPAKPVPRCVLARPAPRPPDA